MYDNDPDITLVSFCFLRSMALAHAYPIYPHLPNPLARYRTAPLVVLQCFNQIASGLQLRGFSV